MENTTNDKLAAGTRIMLPDGQLGEAYPTGGDTYRTVCWTGTGWREDLGWRRWQLRPVEVVRVVG